jgi:hypothetical protein
MSSVLAFLFSLLGVLEKLFTKVYSKENQLREASNREALIQDEAETAVVLANSEDEKLKSEGIDRMRKLVSE